MAIDDKNSVLHAAGKHPWWRSSLYEEPIWLSLAWILGPLTMALVAMYFAVKF
jgi:hypothetical protein